MNPALNPPSFEYTVLGNCWSATVERPWLTAATPPPGRSPKAWKELQTAVAKWLLVYSKLLSTFSFLLCAMVAISLHAVLFPDDEEANQAVFVVLSMVLWLVLIMALEGSCHYYGHLRSAVDRIRPQWQADGWDMDLHTNGRLFFRTGYISLSPRTYQPPSNQVFDGDVDVHTNGRLFSRTSYTSVVVLTLVMTITKTEGWMAPRKPFQGPPGNFGRQQNREQDVNCLWNQTSVVEKEDTISVGGEEEDEVFDAWVESLQEEPKRETHNVKEADPDEADDLEESKDGTGDKATAEDRFQVKGIVLISEVNQ